MNIDEFRTYIEQYWFTKKGIVFAELVVVITLLPVLSSFGVSLLYSLIFCAIAGIFVLVLWILSIRPPKAPKNKVGFLVSIACSNDSDELKVKEDFVIPLRRLVKSGQAGSSFHFMELPQHLAKNSIDQDQAQLIRIKSNAHFMLYGRVRKRELEDGKLHHFFEFDGLVAHKTIPDSVKEHFSKEFSELLPRRVTIPVENDLFSFQFTSEWAEIVAKYIIGISASFSGDIFYAESLFDDVESRLNEYEGKKFPIYLKLKERLPLRKAEIYEAMASSIHKQWAESYDPRLIPEILKWLEKIDEKHQLRFGVIALKAICIFASNKDVDSAINLVKKLPHEGNPVWNLNMAFLYGFNGDLKHSIQQYRAAAQLSIEVEIINQVEGFLNWAIEDNQDKYQLHYCLGFFNWQIRGDDLQANHNFENFLKNCPSEQFIKEQELAQDWMKVIKSKDN